MIFCIGVQGNWGVILFYFIFLNFKEIGASWRTECRLWSLSLDNLSIREKMCVSLRAWTGKVGSFLLETVPCVLPCSGLVVSTIESSIGCLADHRTDSFQRQWTGLVGLRLANWPVLQLEQFGNFLDAYKSQLIGFGRTSWVLLLFFGQFSWRVFRWEFFEPLKIISYEDLRDKALIVCKTLL